MGVRSTVFIVDDDQALCEALRCLIESDGLKVKTFPSAESFLEAYDPASPGVLLLDVRMRGMTGLDLQQHLRERGFAIPIIILTGHADVPMAVRSFEAGALGFLEKPVNDEDLLSRIRKAIRLDAQNRRGRAKSAVLAKLLAQLKRRERELLGRLRTQGY